MSPGPALWFAALGLGLLVLYVTGAAPTVTTANGGADGGELAAAVANGGVPHPPGYPSYLLLGRLGLLLPWGEAAARLAWLNGACVAGAAALLAAALNHLPTDLTPPRRLAAALGAGLLLGLDRRVWEQAVIVEVYAPALLALALLVWLAARWLRWRHRPAAIAGGLVFGMGMGLQLPLAAVLVGLACALAGGWREPQARRGAWLAPGLAVVAGLAVYLVLPWRGGAAPEASWGDWRTLAGGLRHITAGEYAYLVGSVPWGARLGRVSYALRDLVLGLGWWGASLAVVGLAWADGRIRLWRRLTGGTAAAVLAWAVAYGGEDGAVYLLPLHLLGAFWAGVGGLVALAFLSARAPLAGRWACALPLLLLLALPGRQAAISLASRTIDREVALARLRAAPPAAILLTGDDRVTFPLWYARDVLGARPDLAIIDRRLWRYPWYRRRLPCADEANFDRCGRSLIMINDH